MNENTQENNNILFGRLEGSRITKRVFWACFSEKSKKKVRTFCWLKAPHRKIQNTQCW